MNPIDKLTEIEVGRTITISDNRNNLYTGEFKWDSDSCEYYIDDLKIVPDYNTGKLYIVKPIDIEVLDGFLAEVVELEEH